jgi:OmpR family response regulator RpaB
LNISSEKILVADNEIQVRQTLEAYLSTFGYKIILAATGDEALYCFNQEHPHLIILDAMLPKINGYKVCTTIRKKFQTPIIMLTALSKVSDTIVGRGVGVDDYMMKPFSPKELTSRIQSVLRRPSIRYSSLPLPPVSNIFTAGKLTIFIHTGQVFDGQGRIKLTGMEFKLLEFLISKSGECLSRWAILRAVWGYTPKRYRDTRVIDVYISRLRAKVEEDSTNPTLIVTVRGIGYMFHRFKV